jgi:hypothetical protein
MMMNVLVDSVLFNSVESTAGLLWVRCQKSDDRKDLCTEFA